MKKITFCFVFFISGTHFQAQNAPQESHLNNELVIQLDTVYKYDTKYRKEQIEISKKYGFNSKEDRAVWKVIHHFDSLNQLQVSAIIDKYGWLGPDAIGTQGNKTLFLVVQHSDQKMQEKYLPMMREAVKKGRAKGSSLAMLEDRVALARGKEQIYGSQLFSDSTGTYVSPIEDVDNLDRRRAGIGLQSMAEYLKNWQMNWDPEKYKKDLPNSPAYKRMLAEREWLKSGKK